MQSSMNKQKEQKESQLESHTRESLWYLTFQIVCMHAHVYRKHMQSVPVRCTWHILTVEWEDMTPDLFGISQSHRYSSRVSNSEKDLYFIGILVCVLHC